MLVLESILWLLLLLIILNSAFHAPHEKQLPPKKWKATQYHTYLHTKLVCFANLRFLLAHAAQICDSSKGRYSEPTALQVWGIATGRGTLAQQALLAWRESPEQTPASQNTVLQLLPGLTGLGGTCTSQARQEEVIETYKTSGACISICCTGPWVCARLARNTLRPLSEGVWGKPDVYWSFFFSFSSQEQVKMWAAVSVPREEAVRFPLARPPLCCWLMMDQGRDTRAALSNPVRSTISTPSTRTTLRPPLFSSSETLMPCGYSCTWEERTEKCGFNHAQPSHLLGGCSNHYPLIY